VGGPSDGSIGAMTELQLFKQKNTSIIQAKFFRQGRCAEAWLFIDEV
jgi:hypothetical protein